MQITSGCGSRWWDDARRTQTPTAPAGPDAAAAPTDSADAVQGSASLIRLGIERLAQVHVAAQPYTGLAGIARDTVCGRRRPLCGESLLEGERGRSVGGRDVDDRQPGLLHMHFVDLVHVRHYVLAAGRVALMRQRHPTE